MSASDSTASHGNVLLGEYTENPRFYELGSWDQKRYEALSADVRGLIHAIGGGKLDEKKFKCHDSHPLKGDLIEIQKMAEKVIEEQLSEDRIRSDLERFLDNASDSGRVSAEIVGWKERLCDAVLNATREKLSNIRGRAQVVLGEAIMNVIEHGMKHDPRGVGFLTIGMAPDGNFDITTYSEREYDYQAAVVKALDPENIEKPSGRGILMITSLSDEHKFSEHGRCLLIRFHVRQNLRHAILVEASKLGIDISL